MSNDFYKAFEHVPYPCYWLADGNFWCNTAAQRAPVDTELVQGLLARRLRMGVHGSNDVEPVVLPADALRAARLTVLPVEDGLFASLPETESEPAMTAFSAQLREPLTNIFAVLPLLAKRLEDDDLAYADAVQGNCYTLLRLASNLENAGRLEQQAFKQRCVDLSALVDSLCFCASNVCKERGVTITRKLPEQPVLVQGDAALLGEALLNLLRNSLLYTRDGNEIKVKLYQAAGRAVLTVEDKGLGIKPEYLESIFQPYFSVDPYGDGGEKPGLGLGLAVTAQTVQAMGGTITAESRFGEGTRITMALPLAETGNGDEILGSDPADYLLNRYSPIYVQLCGLCRTPAV